MTYKTTLVGLTLAVLLAGCGTQSVQQPQAAQASLQIHSLSSGERYILNLKNAQVSANLQNRIKALGGTLEQTYPGAGFAIVTGLNATAAGTLKSDPEVLGVVRDQEVQVLDPVRTLANDAVAGEGSTAAAAGSTARFAARQWDYPAIGADRVWAALGGKVGSAGVTVAILDTGIDPQHVDLQGLVDTTRSISFVPGDQALVNQFFPGRPAWTDLNGHGSHVASTVSSNGVLANGVTSKTTLMAVKVLGARGSSFQSSVLQGIMYAADHGADVINMSLGGYFNRREASAAGGDGPSYLAVVNKAINYAARKNVTIVVSAGNNATDVDHDGNGYKSYCSAPNVICVSATGPTDSGPYDGFTQNPANFITWTSDVDALAIYSNYGRSAINVAAPGGNYAETTLGAYIWQACSTSQLNYTAITPTTGTFARSACSNASRVADRVAGYVGTSMASPHVTGLAALMVQKYGKNPARVRAAIEQSADDLGQPGIDPAYGKGRINVARAMGVK